MSERETNDVEDKVLRFMYEGGDIGDTSALAVTIGESVETTNDAIEGLTRKGLIEYDPDDDETWRDRLETALRALDETADPKKDKTALILLALHFMGPTASAGRIARLLQIEDSRVAVVKGRLAAGGIISPESGFDVQWMDEEAGGIAFWMDVNVGDGYMERNKNAEGAWVYSLTTRGEGFVEGLGIL